MQEGKKNIELTGDNPSTVVAPLSAQNRAPVSVNGPLNPPGKRQEVELALRAGHEQQIAAALGRACRLGHGVQASGREFLGKISDFGRLVVDQVPFE